MNKYKLLSAAVFSLTLLSACGGGSSSVSNVTSPASTPATPAAPTALSGKVIDGYVEGAIVCLDLNLDQSCSSSEPTGVSKADGSFSLNLNGLTVDQIRLANLLAFLPTTAKDADDGGKTLGEAGRVAFRMGAPANAFLQKDGTVLSAVISPLTSLVAAEIQANPALATSDAEAIIKTKINLASAQNLMGDYIANPDAALHQKARVIASGFSEATRALLIKNSTMNEPTAYSQAMKSTRDSALQLIADVQLRLLTAMSMGAAIQASLEVNGQLWYGFPVTTAAPVAAPISDCPDTLSVAKFNAITPGLTISQIDAVVGCAGKVENNLLTYANIRSLNNPKLNMITVQLEGGTYVGKQILKLTTTIGGVLQVIYENQKAYFGPVN